MISLADFPLEENLRLLRSENVGPVTFVKLIERFGSPKAALERIPQLARRGGRSKPIAIAPKLKIEKEIALTQKFGARYVPMGHEEYPALLQQVHSAPPILVMLGESHFWHDERKSLAIVGSRNASAAGCNLTQQLAREAGERGITIVSGLARGIDAFAHKGALPTGTVGVIAGGIDTLYPPENKPLYEAMAGQGAIISEQAFGATPQAKNFPARNRIIAGMSAGLLVVEAAPRSGSLITARYALEQNREVMAIPGSPMDPRSTGANGLIKQGAALIQSIDDIMEILNRPIDFAENTAQPFLFRQPTIPGEPQESELEEAHNDITHLLSTVPVEVNELARQSQLPAGLLQQILLELELAGKLERNATGQVSLLEFVA
jgi:DNA processing protein